MYNRNIIMYLISLLVSLLLLAFGVFMMIKGSTMYIVLVIALLIYFGYTVVSLIREMKIYSQDKQEGLKEGILEFRRIKILGYEGMHDSRNPNVAVGLFRVCKLEGEDSHHILGKWISLSGDFRKIKLEKRKKYRAGFYISSRQLIYIDTENGKSK